MATIAGTILKPRAVYSFSSPKCGKLHLRQALPCPDIQVCLKERPSSIDPLRYPGLGTCWPQDRIGINGACDGWGCEGALAIIKGKLGVVVSIKYS